MTSIGIPYTNATLTTVKAVGTTGDFDVPAAEGATRWTGAEPIYVHDEPVEVITTDRVDQIVRTRLEMPYAIGRLVQPRDTVVFTYEGATRTRLAKNIFVAPLVDRARVVLEDA